MLPRRPLRFAHHLDAFKAACRALGTRATSLHLTTQELNNDDKEDEKEGRFLFEVAAEEPAVTLRFDSGVPVRGALLVLRRLPS